MLANGMYKVSNLAEPLNASKVKVNDPYVRYGTEVPRTIPGSAQYWRAFGLDLTAMVVSLTFS